MVFLNGNYMSIAKYKSALHLKEYASGGRDIHVTVLPGDGMGGGLFIDLYKRQYICNSTFGGGYQQDAAATVFARVVDKLEPAIQSLFQRYLAEHLEELRVSAVAEAEADRAREIERREQILSEMSRPWNAADES